MSGQRIDRAPRLGRRAASACWLLAWLLVPSLALAAPGGDPPAPGPAPGPASPPTTQPGPAAASRPASQPTSRAASATPSGPPGKPGKLVISGTDRLALAVVQLAAGDAPSDAAAKGRWLDGATGRVLDAYHERGYDYARAWSRVDEDGTLRIDVDEGKVQPVFIGADTVRSLLFRVDLNLPGSVFHRPTVRKALDELKSKYQLVSVYCRVSDERPLVPTRLGNLVPARRLSVYTLGRELFGWRFKMRFSSVWGVLPRVGYKRRDVFFHDDRFLSELEIAVPYRKLVFEDDAQFRWAHGKLDASYRFPPFWGEHIAPELSGATALSHFTRSEPNIQSYLDYSAEGVGSVVLLFPPRLTLKLGGGVDYTRIFELSQPAGAPVAIGASHMLRRWITRAEAALKFDRGLRRRDQRTQLSLRLDVGVSDEGQVLLDSRFHGQLVSHFGRNDVIFRARGVLMGGDVRFWDEAELAGEYLRVFFDNRYWVREALQVEIAARLAVTDWFKLGVFHDAAMFFDRSGAGGQMSFANGFGPGLHFLLFDLFALDLMYGFGFAPVGFDHNIYFSLDSAF